MEDTMAFKEVLKMHLLERLPTETAEAVCAFLIDEHGVESFEDLNLITDEDLKPVLKTVQRRKLLLTWNCQSTSNITKDVVESEFSEQNLSGREQLSETTVSGNWIHNFNVPWGKMPVGLMKLLNQAEDTSKEKTSKTE